MENTPKIIIAGGGTGGHIFPAIAIAEALTDINPNTQILFLGAQNRMEMNIVPQAGYKIIGLPVKGLKRKLSLDNLKTIFLLFKSINKTKKIFKQFHPDAVVGVGGYASAPALYVASQHKIPIILQEQNSLPGITNRIHAKNASAICIAYEENLKYFPEDKCILTGNPIRKEIINNSNISKNQALQTFNLNPNKKTLLITGGSLGALSLNNAVINNFKLIQNANIQLIWQTGKKYFDSISQKFQSNDWLKIYPFLNNIIHAYIAADLVIARAGAITISELSFLAKPTIFVPSPNVAEDHQTKNAQALVNRNAALMIPDSKASSELIPTAINLLQQPDKLNTLSQNIKKFSKPDAANQIANIILKYALKHM